MGGANHEIHQSVLWSDVEYWCSSLHLLNKFKKRKWNINYLDKLSAWHNTVLLCWLIWICWKNKKTDTLCYWPYICWFSSPEENYFNVASIGQYCRSSFRIYSQSPFLKYERSVLLKKLFMGDKPFGQSYWGLFYIGGIMTALCKRRQRVSQMHFPVSSYLNTI